MRESCRTLRARRAALASLPVIATVAFVVALFPASAEAGAGDLDRSFGARGQVMAPFGNAPRDMLVLADGRFLVAGGGMCADSGCGFNIARFKANGEPDGSFGSNGRVVTPIDGVVGISALARQPDGKLVAVGDAAGQDAWVVGRYNANGTPDSSFGSGGVAVTQRAENRAFASAVIVTGEGKLVVAGMVDGTFAIARYNADGSLDASFGDGGKAVTPVGAAGSFARALVELPDGKLLAAGGAEPDARGDQVHVAFVRYNRDGSLDETFGSHGKSLGLPGYASVLVRQPDGKLITAGGTLARYNADGSVDSTFAAGNDSWMMHDVVVEQDGKLVVVGHWPTLYSALWIVRRFEPDGATDRSFCLPPEPLKGEAYAARLRPDGRLLVAGAGVVPGSGYTIRRYRGDGSGPCADTVAPLAKLEIPRHQLGRLLTGRLAVTVAVTEPGRAKLRVEPTRKSARRLGVRQGLTLARGSHRFAHRARERVGLRLTRAANVRLRTARSIAVRVSLVVADRSGNTARLARRLTFRR